MNNEVLDKVDDIIKTIENSEIYQRYLKIKKLLEKDKEIMELINRVKVLQKDVVHKKATKDELDECLSTLKSKPLYLEYCNTLDEINDTFNIIESSINKYFYDKLN